MKTSFLKNVKLFVFLLFAAFGSYVGTAQTTPPNVIISPIGGSKNPDPGPYTNFTNITLSGKIFIVGSVGRNTCGEISICDIGGRGSTSQTPFEEMRIRKYEPSPITKLVVIGGKKDPDPIPITNGAVLSNVETAISTFSVTSYLTDVGLRLAGFSLLFHV